MILIALGSNLPSPVAGPPRATCEATLARLAGHGVEIVGRSRWYRSAPVPRSDQPDFVNGVALVRTARDPDALLRRLHEIERELGRERGPRNAARVIDLDLLACGDKVIGWPPDDDSGLVLPHPRLHERRFVLLPLRDVAPGWRHPVTGDTVEAMLGGLPDTADCAPLD